MVVITSGCSNGERETTQSSLAIVPPAVGLSVDAAVRGLAAAGLRPELHGSAGLVDPSICPSAMVTSQGDPAGTSLVRGSAVVLVAPGCVGRPRLTPSP
ncbi:MAG: hypothetical protein QOK42_989 [Frankiaceae bacterium]|jgi:hypothetical protein|nr:hypothetical protein [Frankiaceae bacterium]